MSGVNHIPVSVCPTIKVFFGCRYILSSSISLQWLKIFQLSGSKRKDLMNQNMFTSRGWISL